VTLLKSGRIAGSSQAAHGATAVGPMAEKVYNSLQRVDDTDLRAMAVYLRSLPAVSPDSGSGSGAIGRSIGQATLDEGRTIYLKECADCHGQKARDTFR
jgi:mono/diheme cytochrome c family protein